MPLALHHHILYQSDGKRQGRKARWINDVDSGKLGKVRRCGHPFRKLVVPDALPLYYRRLAEGRGKGKKISQHEKLEKIEKL